MLLLVGGGLPGLITEKAVDALRRADAVYVDTYTMPLSEWLVEEASRIAGERVRRADRSLLEHGMEKVISEAEELNVVVLVPGDPLVATTHVSLLLEAARRRVPWRVIPGVSGVVVASTITGLQFYKFGRTATIPGPWRAVRAYSLAYYLRCNLYSGLHTVFLLDYHGEEQLQPSLAAAQLLEIEYELSKEEGLEPVAGELLALVVERAGYEESSVHWYTLKDLSESGRRHGFPSSIVIPGLIHETEAEALSLLHGVPHDKMDRHNSIVTALTACRTG